MNVGELMDYLAQFARHQPIRIGVDDCYSYDLLHLSGSVKEAPGGEVVIDVT